MGATVCDHVLSAQATELGRGTKTLPPQAVLINHVSRRLPTFLEAEDLACPPHPACAEHRASLKNCRECHWRGARVSLREKAALEYMEDSLHRRQDGKLEISYPFNDSAFLQRDNRVQARMVQERVEDTVRRKGVEDEYREEMDKAINAGSLREISAEEQARWNGPVHYVTHFGVINLDSKSTKVRVVSNSAMPNANTRRSFNDTTEPVPNALSDLWDILVQWRGHEVAIMYDLAKAYQSVKTGDLELHLRRVLWRPSKELPFKTYGFTCASFGDDPAAAALELAKRRAALDAMEVDELAARQLVASTFVDDAGAGGSMEEAVRMRGEKTPDGSYSGTIPKVLEMGGFRAKAIVMSGNCD